MAIRVAPAVRSAPGPWFVCWLFELPIMALTALAGTVEFFAHVAVFCAVLRLARNFAALPAAVAAGLVAAGTAAHFRLYRRLEAWAVDDRWARLALLAAHAAAGVWAGRALIYAMPPLGGGVWPLLRLLAFAVPIGLNLRFFCARHGINGGNLLA